MRIKRIRDESQAGIKIRGVNDDDKDMMTWTPIIVRIPKELQLLILGHLSHSDLMSVSLTCKGFKVLARDLALWRKLTLKYEKIINSTNACREHVSRCTSLQEIVITMPWDVRMVNSDKVSSLRQKTL